MRQIIYVKISFSSNLLRFMFNYKTIL